MRKHKADIDPSNIQSIIKFFEEHYDYTPQEIRLKYGIPVSTQNYWRRKAKIGKGRPKAFKDHKRKPIKVDVITDPSIWDNGPWFKEMYENRQIGAYVLAKMINRSVTIVYRRLKKFRIDIREQKLAVKPKSKYYDRDWLWENYVRLNRTADDVSKEAGISCYTLFNWLSDLEIPIRGKSDYLVIKTRKRKARERRERENESGLSKTEGKTGKPPTG